MEEEENNPAFEALKTEIRSVLMPFKEGCSLAKFRKEYKTLLGRAVPAAKFDYRDDIELLYNISDVVDISKRFNDLHLMAVADASTAHIQRMVSQQKKSTKAKSSKYSNRLSGYASRTSFTRYPYAYSQSYSSYQQPAYRQSSASVNHYSSVPAARNTTMPSNINSQPLLPVANTPLHNRPPETTSNFRPAVNKASDSSINYSPAAYKATNATENYSSPAGNQYTASYSPAPHTATNAAENYGSAVGYQFKAVNNSPVVGKPVSTIVQPAVATNSNRPPTALSNQDPITNFTPPSTTRAPPTTGNSPPANGQYHSSQSFQKNLPPQSLPYSNKLLPLEVECKVVEVVKRFATGIRMTDFLLAYKNHHKQEFPLEEHGFTTLEECMETLPQLTLTPLKSGDFTIIYNPITSPQGSAKVKDVSLFYDSGKSFDPLQPAASLSTGKPTEVFKFTAAWTSNSAKNVPHQSSSQDQNKWNINLEPAVVQSPSAKSVSSKSKADVLDHFEVGDRNVCTLGLTERMRNRFQEIISNYKQGICAKDFPIIYEKMTGSRFDLHSLGFTDLASLVDSFPDVLHRKRVAGSGNDWLIVPASGYHDPEQLASGNQSKSTALQIELCIQNIRMLLEGYSEGILLDSFLQVYCINCNEPLYIMDLGFDSIENFLLSISERVPLKIELQEGYRTIFLDNAKGTLVTEQEEVVPEASIPFDAASPDCEYKKLNLSMELETAAYIAVYVSHINSPEHFYIQLGGSVAKDQLEKPLEMFYRGPMNDHYIMQERHVKPNAMCVCLWPSDQLWYRATILEIVSQGLVRVLYVDYGTTDTVPVTLLRYLKESFTKLPAQALKASLAFMKPPKGQSAWGPEAKVEMLRVCKDILLMAKIVEIEEDGNLSLILCNTTGEAELYIDDHLLDKGLASMVKRNDEHSTPPAPPTPSPSPPTQEDDSFSQLLCNTTGKGQLDVDDHLLDKNLPSIFKKNTEYSPTTVPSTPSPTLPTQELELSEHDQRLQAQCFFQTVATLSPSMGREQLTRVMRTLAQNYPDNPVVQQTVAGMNANQALKIPNLLPNKLIASYAAYQPVQTTMLGQFHPRFPAYQASAEPAPFVSNRIPPGFGVNQFAAVNQIPPGFAVNQFAANNQIPPWFGVNQFTAVNQSGAGSVAQLDVYHSNLGEDSEEDSEIFEDDDDGFDEFLEKSSSVVQRYVKRVRTSDGYQFHILIVDAKAYISSGDLSHLIWNKKQPDHLLIMLQNKDVVFESQCISEEGNEAMFHQFQQFYVKGIQQEDETTSVIIYPLQSTIRILNLFGQPSLKLRQKIRNEVDSFEKHSHLPAWQELPEMEIPDGEDDETQSDTDDAKLNRLCMSDLKCMERGLRKKMESNRNSARDLPASVELRALMETEMRKDADLHEKVEIRMADIETVCRNFS